MDESLSEDDVPGPGIHTTPKLHKKTFMQSMLKAEKISQNSTSMIDQARTHCDIRLQNVSDKKTDEAAISRELQKKQQEIENILNKKKEEEQLKRLEFEEERIKEENEKLKTAAEEKRKRDEEDERINQETEEWRKREEEKRLMYLTNQNNLNDIHIRDESNVKPKASVDSLEEQRLIDEDWLIQLGRIEAQREYEDKRYFNKQLFKFNMNKLAVNSDKPGIQNIDLICACERIPMGKDNWEIGTLDLFFFT